MRTVEALADLVSPNGVIGVMSSGLGSIAGPGTQTSDATLPFPGVPPSPRQSPAARRRGLRTPLTIVSVNVAVGYVGTEAYPWVDLTHSLRRPGTTARMAAVWSFDFVRKSDIPEADAPSSLSDWRFRRGLGRAAGDFGELKRPSRWIGSIRG